MYGATYIEKYFHHQGFREEKNKKEELFVEEIIAENLPNLKEEIYIQIWEAQRIINK